MCRQSFFTSPDQPLLVKITTTDAPVKSHDHLLLCFDVSKRSLTLYSKKGRPLLRKILGQTTFPLLRRPHLYGRYYHRKRREGMLGQKAKVAVMRKFLGMLYALTQSGEAFDPVRFATCESQYRQAA